MTRESIAGAAARVAVAAPVGNGGGSDACADERRLVGEAARAGNACALDARIDMRRDGDVFMVVVPVQLRSLNISRHSIPIAD